MDPGDSTAQRVVGWPRNKFQRRHHGAGGLCRQTETEKDEGTTNRVGSRKQNENLCIFTGRVTQTSQIKKKKNPRILEPSLSLSVSSLYACIVDVAIMAFFPGGLPVVCIVLI